MNEYMRHTWTDILRSTREAKGVPSPEQQDRDNARERAAWLARMAAAYDCVTAEGGVDWDLVPQGHDLARDEVTCEIQIDGKAVCGLGMQNEILWATASGPIRMPRARCVDLLAREGEFYPGAEVVAI